MFFKTATKLEHLTKYEITQLQKLLNDKGFSVGIVDGLLGVKTKNAWRQFKESNHLNQYDMIGQSSLEILQSLQNVGNIDWYDNSFKISRYFTVGDVTQRDGQRIPNNESHIQNILKIAKELDNVRKDWGNPIGVTSWYRPTLVNERVGGAKNSQHLNGGAVDIYPINRNIFEFQTWLDKRWDKALGYGAKKGFVHVDLREGRIRWNY